MKTRLIDANAGVMAGTRAILKAEGIGGLYKGLTATVLKQVKFHLYMRTNALSRAIKDCGSCGLASTKNEFLIFWNPKVL